MLPRFKYLSEKLFSPKNLDYDRYLREQDGSWTPFARTKPEAGEIITTTQRSVTSSHSKQGGIFTSERSGSFFAGATNFTMNYPTFIDESNTTIVIDFSVLPRLESAGTPEAALDSGARHPPPKCHPGSRRTINGRLEKWLLDLYRQRKMTWLYGPPGIGKSAIAQTFGELAREHGCLGAAFFSAFNDLPTDSSRIIPTLAYQLAIRIPNYKNIVTHQLADDPSVLRAALPVQFQKLIIKPFSLLTSPGEQQTSNNQPYVIILDGLDECEDEKAQCELIELINEAAQKKDLPLIWLLCSRPESHIKYTFSQLEYVQSCDREELVIDDEARADVERFLRESFQEIHKRYGLVIAVWPSEEAFDKISTAVSGYFVFASAATRVVDDPIVGDPEDQLALLLRMLQGLDDIGMNNPLEALDVFYSRILSRVPEPRLPIAIQILGICARDEPSEHFVHNAEQLRLFLRIEKEPFYHSLKQLHSVVRVPSLEGRRDERLSFYHKSFADYLINQRRSGKFFLSYPRIITLLGINSLYWYNHVLTYENPDLVQSQDEHNRSQAELKKWSESGNEFQHYRALTYLSYAPELYCGQSMRITTEGDSDFFDAMRKFNFGLLTRAASSALASILVKFSHVCDWSESATAPHLIRTEVVDEVVDLKLLHHLSILTDGKPISPINLREPVVYDRRGWACQRKDLQPNTMGYLIIGQGSKSGLIFCFQEAKVLQTIVLNLLIPPTASKISQYRQWVKKMEHPELERQHDQPEETLNDECRNQ